MVAGARRAAARTGLPLISRTMKIANTQRSARVPAICAGTFLGFAASSACPAGLPSQRVIISQTERPLNMRVAISTRLIPLAAAAIVAACAGDARTNREITAPGGPAASQREESGDGQSGESEGAVYTMTNGAAGNAIVAFRRAADGSITPLGSFATGGAGTGGTVDPLISQYSLLLNDNHSLLFAVNAGSNEITTFRVGDDGELSRPRVTSSGGVRPTSVAVHRNLLYVLNAGSNLLRGYRIGASGELAALPGATTTLPSGAAGAAAVRFSPNGENLLVSERVSNRIDVFPVQANGRLGEGVAFASHGGAAFGFDITPSNDVIVSETASNPPNGGLSSYALRGDALSLVTGSATTGGAAPCWVLNTRDGHYSYAVNSASSTITTFEVNRDGSIAAEGAPVSTGAATTPLDPAFSTGDRFLYFIEGRSGDVSGFATGTNGGLTAVTKAHAGAGSSGLQGLAAF